MTPIRATSSWGWMPELVKLLFGSVPQAPDSAFGEIMSFIEKTVNFHCVAIVEYDDFFVFIDGCDDSEWVVRRGLRLLGKPFHYLKLQYNPATKYPFVVHPFTYLVPKPLEFHEQVMDLRRRYRETPKEHKAWGRFMAVSLDRHNLAAKMRECGITVGGQYCTSPTGYEASNLDAELPRERMPFDRYLDYFVKSASAIDARGFGDFTHRMIEAFAIGTPLIRPRFVNTTHNPIKAGYHYLDCGPGGAQLQSVLDLVDNNPSLLMALSKRGTQWYDENASPTAVRSLYQKIITESQPNPTPDLTAFEPLDHFFGRIQGWFDFEDVYMEAIARASDGARFVEVGCWKGRSTAFLAVAIANSRKSISLDCIDTWRGSAEHQEDPDLVRLNGNVLKLFVDNVQEVAHLLNVVQKPSTDAVRLYDDGSLDFVFIDANHETDAVIADIKAWLPKVKPGGMLAGHDIGWPTVKAAVDATVGSGYTIRGYSWTHQVPE